MPNSAKNTANLKMSDVGLYSNNNYTKGEKVIPYNENKNIHPPQFEELCINRPKNFRILEGNWTDENSRNEKDCFWFIENKKHLCENTIFTSLEKKLFPNTKDKSIPIYLDGIEISQLDPKFEELNNSINKSKYILELENNWDDEGSRKYDKDTWIGAIRFLCNYATFINNYNGNIIPTPNIYHGPHGSIDMEWQKENFYLLINIDKQVREVSFYSKTATQEFEGKFQLTNYNPELIPLCSIFNTYFLNV